MRLTTLLLALTCLSSIASPSWADEPTRQARIDQSKSVDLSKSTAEKGPPFKAEHPGDTALSQDDKGNWRFRTFPGLATLYINDKDTPGKSNCGAPCASAWAPFIASSTENKPIGDWTLIARPDGKHQWAYKGQPIYLRYHDLPAESGNIQKEGFRKLEP